MKEKTLNVGFSVGITASIIMLLLHIVVDLIYEGRAISDYFLWGIQVIFYFFIGMTAANKDYHNNIDMDEPLNGMLNAARGSGMVLSAIIWVYIFLRAMIVGAFQVFGGLGIGMTMAFLVLDFSMAIGLSTFGGSLVKEQHDFDIYE